MRARAKKGKKIKSYYMSFAARRLAGASLYPEALGGRLVPIMLAVSRLPNVEQSQSSYITPLSIRFSRPAPDNVLLQKDFVYFADARP